MQLSAQPLSGEVTKLRQLPWALILFLSLSLSHSMGVCGWVCVRVCVGGELMIAYFQQYFLKVLITIPLP